MWRQNLIENRYLIYQYVKVGVFFALIYAFVEYFVDKSSENPELLIPLIIRACIGGAVVMFSAAIFEISFRRLLARKTFLFHLMIRSLVYTFIISFWMITINIIWLWISRGFTVGESFYDYVTDQSFIINLSTIFFLMVIVLTINQINSLNKKNALRNFLLGRYNVPKEVDRIFCFVDLKNSTGIAEQLGHLKYASFLKDYYADISHAIERCKGEAYQYIGDEVVIVWDYNVGVKNKNCLQCFHAMKTEIEKRKKYFEITYSVFPEFRGGVHCGRVTTTWVGGTRKEIMYLGDVLNTAKRIQESCKRLKRDYLISKSVIALFDDPDSIKTQYLEETTLRGKEEKVELYTLS